MGESMFVKFRIVQRNRSGVVKVYKIKDTSSLEGAIAEFSDFIFKLLPAVYKSTFNFTGCLESDLVNDLMLKSMSKPIFINDLINCIIFFHCYTYTPPSGGGEPVKNILGSNKTEFWGRKSYHDAA